MKRVLIISDTHRSFRGCEKVAEIEAKVDLVIHAGDSESKGSVSVLERLFDCEVVMVDGNCDRGWYEQEICFTMENHRFFVTHGERYFPAYTTDELANRGLEAMAEVIIYGHTHVPEISYKASNGKYYWLINPGSLERPRQTSREKTYIILTIDDKGGLDFRLKYL